MTNLLKGVEIAQTRVMFAFGEFPEDLSNICQVISLSREESEMMLLNYEYLLNNWTQLLGRRVRLCPRKRMCPPVQLV